MPKPLLHALIWSHEQKHYKLYSHGQPEQCFPPGDEQAFSRWLDGHTAFAFEGQAGRISVLKEARSRGTGYWYAYRTQNRHTRKRYLGRTAQVTFARLEQEAKVLDSSPAPLAMAKTSPLSEQKGICFCRKWKDHAALSMDGCILEATGKWEQGRRTRTRCCLALP